MLSSIQKAAMTAGTVAGLLMLAAGNASAFTFDTNWTGAPPKKDIILDSVVIDGTTILFQDLAKVSEANITQNKPLNGSTSSTAGGASTDKGDLATGPAPVNALPLGSSPAVVDTLKSNNLNNIIDTEDSGFFTMTLNFDRAFNKLLFWERGLNSKLGVRINGVEKIFGNDKNTLTGDFKPVTSVGYSIDTTEINGAQPVGSYGLDLSEFNVQGKWDGPVVLFATSQFNGPDFKVMGASVPEPATVLGLTAVAGAFVASRRRKAEA